MPNKLTEKPRTCDGCTKCCEGWLRGSAHGINFYRGKPCHYADLENHRCSIYEQRPKSPCETYKCEWLTNHGFPHWLKPSLCNVIITKKEKDGIQYYEIMEAGAKMDSAVLNWFIMWALTTGQNIFYTVDNGPNRIGSKEFVELKSL